jgi:hypothetical protein
MTVVYADIRKGALGHLLPPTLWWSVWARADSPLAWCDAPVYSESTKVSVLPSGYRTR